MADYYLVNNHYGDDYFVKDNGNPEQIDEIEMRCPFDGEQDTIVDEFSSEAEGHKVLRRWFQQNHFSKDTKQRLRADMQKLFQQGGK